MKFTVVNRGASLDLPLKSIWDSKAKNIVIMVDLSAGLWSEQSGVVPTLKVFKELCCFLLKEGASNISVIGSSTSNDSEDIFERLGYTSAFRENKIINFNHISKMESIKIIDSKCQFIRGFSIPEVILWADEIVILSTPKTHISQFYSGAMYSLPNILSNSNYRNKLIPAYRKVIEDLTSVISPSMTIIDGTYLLTGLGPIQGEPKKIEKVIIAENPRLADEVMVKILDIDIRKVSYLRSYLNNFNIEEKINYNFYSCKTYIFFKLAESILRIGLFFNRLYVLIYLAALALTSIGGRDLITGKWMSFKAYLTVMKEIISKMDEETNLFEWKISINKHVKEQSLS